MTAANRIQYLLERLAYISYNTKNYIGIIFGICDCLPGFPCYRLRKNKLLQRHMINAIRDTCIPQTKNKTKPTFVKIIARILTQKHGVPQSVFTKYFHCNLVNRNANANIFTRKCHPSINLFITMAFYCVMYQDGFLAG